MADSAATLSNMVVSLEMTGRYRVLEAFRPRSAYQVAKPGAEIRKLLVIDGETTGGSLESDDLIELGYVIAEFDKTTGEVFRVLKRYRGLEQARSALPARVSALTGLTDSQLQGQRFAEERIIEDVGKVDLAVAPGSGFLRMFLERRFPVFEGLWFGCTTRDVDWSRYGASANNLELLAYKVARVFYEPCGALHNAEVLLHLLEHQEEGNYSPLLELIGNSRKPRWRVRVEPSTKEAALALKSAGFLPAPKPAGSSTQPWEKETADWADVEWVSESVVAAGQAFWVGDVSGRDRFSGRCREMRELIGGEPTAPRQATSSEGQRRQATVTG